jgi:hypothetical protein
MISLYSDIAIRLSQTADWGTYEATGRLEMLPNAACRKRSDSWRRKAYLSSSAVSNFFGFFGQQSHMKKPCILLPGLVTSWSFRGDANDRLSLMFRWCGVLDIEALGDGFRDIGVANGELQLDSVTGDMPPGDGPPGDRRPYEFILVMLLVAPIDRFEVYDPLLVDTDDIDP